MSPRLAHALGRPAASTATAISSNPARCDCRRLLREPLAGFAGRRRARLCLCCCPGAASHCRSAVQWLFGSARGITNNAPAAGAHSYRFCGPHPARSAAGLLLMLHQASSAERLAAAKALSRLLSMATFAAAPQTARVPRLRAVLGRRRGHRSIAAVLIQALQLLDVREPSAQRCATVREHRELRAPNTLSTIPQRSVGGRAAGCATLQ